MSVPMCFDYVSTYDTLAYVSTYDSSILCFDYVSTYVAARTTAILLLQHGLAPQL